MPGKKKKAPDDGADLPVSVTVTRQVEETYGTRMNRSIDEVEILIREGRLRLLLDLSWRKAALILGGIGTAVAAFLHWAGVPP